MCIVFNSVGLDNGKDALISGAGRPGWGSVAFERLQSCSINKRERLVGIDEDLRRGPLRPCVGAGAGASGTTTQRTTTTGKTKHHSAGTAHVATKLAAHSSASRTSVSAATARRTVVTSKAVTHGRGHGARPTLAVRRTRYHEHFSASSFADNLTLGDVTRAKIRWCARRRSRRWAI